MDTAARETRVSTDDIMGNSGVTHFRPDPSQRISSYYIKAY